MIKKIRELLTPPSADVLAQRELEEARRELLRAQTQQDYAASVVQYQQARIRRLEASRRAMTQ